MDLRRLKRVLSASGFRRAADLKPGEHGRFDTRDGGTVKVTLRDGDFKIRGEDAHNTFKDTP